jgi:plastocyanin
VLLHKENYFIILLAIFVSVASLTFFLPLLHVDGITANQTSSPTANQTSSPTANQTSSPTANQTSSPTANQTSSPKTKSNKPVHTINIEIARDSRFPDNEKFYVPSNATIEGNTTVIWLNNDTVPHSVTSGNPEEGPTNLFDSSLIAPNNRYNHTFTKIGVYDYYDQLHPYIKGKLVVTKQTRKNNIMSPEELPNNQNVSIVKGSSFPDNGKFFQPQETSIGINGTVKWTNNDTVVHTVVLGQPKKDIVGQNESGLIQPRKTYKLLFSKPGIFDYYCEIHPYMTGKVSSGLYTYFLSTKTSEYPIRYMIVGNGNELEKINLQSLRGILEIRLVSQSPGNISIVIPRVLLDSVNEDGKDYPFSVLGNTNTKFNETSTSSVSRTLLIGFGPGAQIIQVSGTKNLPAAFEESTSVTQQANKNGIVEQSESAGPSNLVDKYSFAASLSGDDMIPPIYTDASGTAVVKGNDNVLRYEIKLVNIDRVSAINFHQGSNDEIGDIIATLYSKTVPTPSKDLTIKGDLNQLNFVGPMKGKSISNLIDSIKAGKVYVNVKSMDFPDGEIRGSLSPENG